MKVNNYLITVTNKEILNLKAKNISFLFPVTGYSVGYTYTFSFEEISIPNSFIYINRILDKNDIVHLKEDLQHLDQNIIGICFTDLGIINIIKELGLNMKLIYMQNHNTTNVVSINYYLEYVDSVLISTDITKKEIFTILDHANKPLVLPYFCKVNAMYSRRKLLTNFQEEFKLPKEQEITLHEDISNVDFFVQENDYGTVFYPSNFIDYRNLKHSNILYYYINPLGLSKNEVEQVLNGKDLSSISDTGFLYKETYYRLKEDKE